MKTALVAGATGLIGSQLVEQLLLTNYYDSVIVLSRQPLKSTHSKLRSVVTDLSTLEQHKSQLVADDIFCCLGTTMGEAKSRVAFRRVDFDYPLAIAKMAHEVGAKQYLLVSSLGANKNSMFFYNRVKGEIEEAVLNTGFECVHILRPSLLLGARKERRSGDKAAQWVYARIAFLLPKKLRAIESVRVARAMRELAKKGEQGNFIHDSGELQEF